MQFFYTAAASRRKSQSSQNIYLLYRVFLSTIFSASEKSEFSFAVPYIPAVISVSTNHNLKLSS